MAVVADFKTVPAGIALPSMLGTYNHAHLEGSVITIPPCFLRPPRRTPARHASSNRVSGSASEWVAIVEPPKSAERAFGLGEL